MRDRQKHQRALTLGALGLATMLTLSGCSANYWPSTETAKTPEATAAADQSEPQIAPVPVTQGQIQRIVDRVSDAATNGDKDLDPAALEGRFAGDALAQRTANYKIRKAVADYASVPAPITNKMLDYRLVQSTESWPRTLLVTVASEAAKAEDGKEQDAPSLALVLKQRIPQENFRVSRVVSLRGGIVMPKAAPAEEGTAVLAEDIDSLVLQPKEVGKAYAAILQGGTEVAEAQSFDLTDDPLIANYGKAWAVQAKQKSDSEDKTQEYSVTVAESDQPNVALSTGVGGALVATTVIETQVVDSAGGRFKPQAEGAVSALSGLTGQQDKIVRQVAHQLLFFVPSKEDGSQIQLLGVTSELVGAGK